MQPCRRCIGRDPLVLRPLLAGCQGPCHSCTALSAITISSRGTANSLGKDGGLESTFWMHVDNVDLRVLSELFQQLQVILNQRLEVTAQDAHKDLEPTRGVALACNWRNY